MSIWALGGEHHWRQLNVSDAHFMGRLAVAGLALPNAPHLKGPAAEVTDFGNPAVQREVERLVAAADAIARMPGVAYGGLHHIQLATTPDSPGPLNMMLTPSVVPGARTEITTGQGQPFQCIVNPRLVLPERAAARKLTTPMKEGCFSSGPVSAVTNRPDTIYELDAHNRYGEPIFTAGVTGFPATSIQHEENHGRGIRAADTTSIRNWVSRDVRDQYRKLAPENAGGWSQRCSPEQWLALSGDPEYIFFGTPELQEAFAAGQEAQRQVQAH